MKDLKKSTISIIRETGINSNKPFGDLLFEKVFINFGIVLSNDKDICFLTKTGESDDVQSLYYRLNFVLSLLDDLSRNNLILHIPLNNQSQDIPSVFCKNKDDVTTDGCQLNTYNIGEGLLLKIDENTNSCMIFRDKKSFLSGVFLTNMFLYEKIKTYCDSLILPTLDLDQYIMQGYRTYGELSLHYSRVALIIAVIVACLSPLLSVFISNKLGYISIEKKQFSILSDKTIVVDTVLHQPKSVQTIVSIEPGNNSKSNSTYNPK